MISHEYNDFFFARSKFTRFQDEADEVKDLAGIVVFNIDGSANDILYDYIHTGRHTCIILEI